MIDYTELQTKKSRFYKHRLTKDEITMVGNDTTEWPADKEKHKKLIALIKLVQKVLLFKIENSLEKPKQQVYTLSVCPKCGNESLYKSTDPKKINQYSCYRYKHEFEKPLFIKVERIT